MTQSLRQWELTPSPTSFVFSPLQRTSQFILDSRLHYVHRFPNPQPFRLPVELSILEDGLSIRRRRASTCVLVRYSDMYDRRGNSPRMQRGEETKKKVNRFFSAQTLLNSAGSQSSALSLQG